MGFHYEINQGKTGESLTIGAGITYTDVELDIIYTANPSGDTSQAIYEDYGSPGDSWYYMWAYSGGTDKASCSGWSTSVNGVAQSSVTAGIASDTKLTLRLTSTSSAHTTTISSGGTHIGADSGTSRFATLKVYGLRYYNAGTLVANFDLTTGSFTEQLGTGKTLTPTGGTWVNDGGSSSTGTNGSTSFNTKQILYKTSLFNYDTKQSIYQTLVQNFSTLQQVYLSGSTNLDTKQSIYLTGSINQDTKQIVYQSGLTNLDTKQSFYQSGMSNFDSRQTIYNTSSSIFDSKQIIYTNSSTLFNTKQIVYQVASTLFDTLQQITDSGIAGSTKFDTRMVLYSNNQTVYDTKQSYYQTGSSNYELKQAIYQASQNNMDMKLVLYTDSYVNAEMVQQFHQTGTVSFDTEQILFDKTTLVIGTVILQGNKQLEIYLVGSQTLNVILSGKQSLNVNLKGVIN